MEYALIALAFPTAFLGATFIRSGVFHMTASRHEVEMLAKGWLT